MDERMWERSRVEAETQRWLAENRERIKAMEKEQDEGEQEEIIYSMFEGPVRIANPELYAYAEVEKGQVLYLVEFRGKQYWVVMDA